MIGSSIPDISEYRIFEHNLEVSRVSDEVCRILLISFLCIHAIKRYALGDYKIFRTAEEGALAPAVLLGLLVALFAGLGVFFCKLFLQANSKGFGCYWEHVFGVSCMLLCIGFATCIQGAPARMPSAAPTAMELAAAAALLVQAFAQKQINAEGYPVNLPVSSGQFFVAELALLLSWYWRLPEDPAAV